jgi:hypothetical protein
MSKKKASGAVSNTKLEGNQKDFKKFIYLALLESMLNFQ